MSSSRPPQSSPYLDRGRAGLSWGTVLVRTFLILLPALLVGFFVGVLVFGALGADHPRLSWGINVVPGLVAGAALGRLLTPAPNRRLAYLGISAVMGVVLVLLLLALASTRMSGGGSPAASAVAGGLAVTVVLQVVVAGALWWLRGRGR